MEQRIKDLLDAWNIKGSHPEYHDMVKSKLEREWPSLYIAISNLVKQYEL